MPKITKRPGRDPASAFRAGIPDIDATGPAAPADNLRNFSAIADAFFNILKDLNTARGAAVVPYKTMTKTAFKDLQAIVELFDAVEFKGRVEMRDYLKNKLKEYFQANHPPFPALPADLENRAEIEAAFRNLHDQFYVFNGATGNFDEIHVARADYAANFTNIARAIGRMGKAIIDACDDTLRIDDPVEIRFDFETHNDDLPAPKLYSFNRMDKEKAKNPNNLLLVDPSTYRALRNVDINDVTDDVGSKLQAKSNKSSADSSKDDSPHFGSKDDEDSIQFNNVANSTLVFDERMVFNTATHGVLEVGRVSHHDNTPKSVFKLQKDAATGAVVLTADQKTVCAADKVEYLSEAGEDDTKISDDVAHKAVVKKGLSLAAKSLVGSKIDHRFVTISIPGNDTPDAAGIKAVIDAAMLALPQIIPIFREDLARHLDAHIDTAGPEARAHYDLIKQIQAAAAPKTVEAMKQAYSLYADSAYVASLGATHQAKIKGYDV